MREILNEDHQLIILERRRELTDMNEDTSKVRDFNEGISNNYRMNEWIPSITNDSTLIKAVSTLMALRLGRSNSSQWNIDYWKYSIVSHIRNTLQNSYTQA